MKFGVREICDVVFKAKSTMRLGSQTFIKGQPVLYIDTATASTLEQASTTVYASGGKGNSRLIAWDGEKTLTFTVTDALMSPVGLSILSGAGLFKGKASTSEKINVHFSTKAIVAGGKVDLSDILTDGEEISENAPLFVNQMNEDAMGEIVYGCTVTTVSGTQNKKQAITVGADLNGKEVFVDCYIEKGADSAHEVQIESSSFGSNFYVEASTLFRKQADGTDVPAEITLPNVKIQSNITFSMASTGDPSTFDFTMDALPDYTMFDKTKKVLCVIQILDDSRTTDIEPKTVMDVATTKPESDVDSTDSKPASGGATTPSGDSAGQGA